jgi:hypothetical protein
VKFPRIIRHRKAEVTIYGKKPRYPFYRLAYRADGKRHLRSFAKYGVAVEEADKKVRELADGSQAAALTAKQSRDALAAFERLDALQRAIGRPVSLLAAVPEFADAAIKSGGRNLAELVTAYQATVTSVKRKDVAEAVKEFIAMREPLTEAKEGKRAQPSKDYAYHVALWLRDFGSTFPATAVCDLRKEHLNLFMQRHASHAPKSRNHNRGAVKMFLTWCAKRDYVSTAHRLFEADSTATESADMQELDFFRPEELKAMLEPCGYVQATGQTRKVIGNFIRSIKAKPTSKLVKKERGKPKDLYGLKTNGRVLDQWLTEWCDQEPEKKYEVVLREALILAAAAAESKFPVNEKRLARVRSILKTNVKHAAKQIDADSDFNFLRCRADCISEIRRLSESLQKPRDERPFKEHFSDYVIKVLVGEPAEHPLPRIAHKP